MAPGSVLSGNQQVSSALWPPVNVRVSQEVIALASMMLNPVPVAMLNAAVAPSRRHSSATLTSPRRPCNPMRRPFALYYWA